MLRHELRNPFRRFLGHGRKPLFRCLELMRDHAWQNTPFCPVCPEILEDFRVKDI